MENENNLEGEIFKYKRSRFTASFSTRNLYSKGHYWFAPPGDGVFRVGLTKFAARMLGELVEFGFEIKKGESFKVGDILGWMEGFKAASDIYALINGEFLQENKELVENPEFLHARPHDRGWLYEMRLPEIEQKKLMNVNDYCQFLNGLIDKMTGKEE